MLFMFATPRMIDLNQHLPLKSLIDRWSGGHPRDQCSENVGGMVC